MSVSLSELLRDAGPLRVNEERPHCWSVRLPALWRRRAAAARRRELIGRLLSTHEHVALGVVPDTGRDGISWNVSKGREFVWPTGDEIGFGSWALILFRRRAPLELPATVGIRCQEVQQLLRAVEGSVAVVSLPDDDEWLVAEAVGRSAHDSEH